MGSFVCFFGSFGGCMSPRFMYVNLSAIFELKIIYKSDV